MPTSQENNRLQNFEEALSRAAQTSERLVDAMSTALVLFQRDKEMIISRLTNRELSDEDYLHNGASSPTIGETKKALRSIVSYAFHQGSLTEAEATGILSDAGVPDTSLLSTKQIVDTLEPLRV